MLHAAVILAVLTASPPSDKLAAYIIARQPRARPYAALMAARVLTEGKQHRIRPAALIAVAWVESRFRRDVVSRTADYGLWQLRATDYRMPSAWRRLWRAGLLPAGMVGAPWWRMPATARWRALKDVRVSAALAAAELAGVRAWCRRAGHRVNEERDWRLDHRGRWKRVHAQEIDRFGHHLTGSRWPRSWYVKGLRREYRRIRRALAR